MSTFLTFKSYVDEECLLEKTIKDIKIGDILKTKPQFGNKKLVVKDVYYNLETSIVEGIVTEYGIMHLNTFVSIKK